MSGELTIACSLCNEHVRKDVKFFIDDINWETPLAKCVATHFRDIDGKNLGLGELRTKLASFGDDTSQQVMNIIKDYVSLSDTAIASSVKNFSDKYNEFQVAQAFKQPDARSIINFIKNDIKDVDLGGKSVEFVDLSEADIEKIIREEGGAETAIPSHFDFIKDSNPYGGYLLGQVVMVCAPPGTGKTLFMLNEVANMLALGKKGVWFSLGDMITLDFITRISSIVRGIPMFEAAISPSQAFNADVRALLSNLKLATLPADSITPGEMLNIMNNKMGSEEIDFVVIDYDANFKKVSDSMYNEGDAVYNTASHIARPKNSRFRTVFIASQPKIQYWDQELLPKESAAESSRKQAIIDMMITIGRNRKLTGHGGMVNIAKQRRGTEGVSSHYKVESSGRFKMINSSEYSLMKNFTS
jgi:hypothetical protein